MKDILSTVIKRLGTQKTRHCRIKHKRGWLEYLEDGDLVFKPSELHNILRRVVDSEGNRPRGDKLLTLRKRTSFTARKNKAPYRPEEALERFIIVSNSDKSNPDFARVISISCVVPTTLITPS